MTSDDKLDVFLLAVFLFLVGMHILALTVEPAVDEALDLKHAVEHLEGRAP